MATHEEVIGRWMTEVGRSDPDLLHSSENIFVSKNNDAVLFYDRESRGRWGHGRPSRNIPLAMFIGRRYRGGACLLNGDGMEDRTAMQWQTHVRTRAQAAFGEDRVAIVPFAALRSAEIDLQTFKIIQVTQDTHENVHRPIPNEPYGGEPSFKEWLNKATMDDLIVDGWKRESEQQGTQSAQAWLKMVNSRRWRVTYRVSSWAEASLSSPDVVPERNPDGSYKVTQWSLIHTHIWAQPENGVPNWQVVSMDLSNQLSNQLLGMFWTEAIHRLGASVFRANGADGRPHRWISAFDTQETDPLYFLAQLPDRGKCHTYDDAIQLLAPEIVHQARAQGRHVARQGDVFAIQTELTDAAIYKDVRTRVRREIALQDTALLHRTARGKLIDPVEGEVRERGVCPMCNCKPWVGNGPAAHRALMIHGTAHTASEVVVKSNGVTFVRGTMYHDPMLETAGRQPEHSQVNLREAAEADAKWYLAIRNTVPRQRSRRTQQVIQQDVQTTDAPERGGAPAREEVAA